MDEANGLSIDATLPKRPLPDVIKEEAGLAVSEELSSDDTSICGTPLQVPQAEQIDHMDGYEEEERPTKKQVVIPDTPNVGNSAPGLTELPSHAGAITPASQNGSGKPKKSKKRSKDVWSSTSRKGKKKTKHASNGKNTANGNAEDRVLITPILRCPDKSDDSPDLKICLSKVHKAEKVELSDDRLSAGSTKGYRMVRATRGVREGAWYFEIKVVCLGETGHTRLGWSTDKADLQAPVGYDGNSFGYRDVDGSKVHKALRENYGNGYKEGDVIGCYINLPNGGAYAPGPLRMAWYKGQRCVFGPDANADPPKVVPGSEMCYFKNGVCQGTAFKDIHGGQYYPAASMYTLPNQPNCVVKFNFGPNFEAFPDDFNGSPIPRPMMEVPYEVFDGRVENGVSTENKH